MKFLPEIAYGEALPLPELLRPWQLLAARGEEAVPLPRALLQIAMSL